MRRLLLLGIVYATFACAGSAQTRPSRYALVLSDAPVAEHTAGGKDLRLAAAQDRRQVIESAQGTLRAALADRGVRVTGANQVLVNAVYVVASPEEAAALATMPGVERVLPLRPLRRHMDRALELVRATTAWNSVGGVQNAGAGVRIAIIDTGIDQTHPSFQDSSLQVPAGFPKGPDQFRSFTNNKVIVARSYVDMLNFHFGNDPADTRPDDNSPRDRVGHGTATAMVAAGARVVTNGVTISGVAPKAFVGNYKVFGSPGVNDVVFDDVVITALEDALADGMDIAVLAIGKPAEWGPLDRICGTARNQPCDLWTDVTQRLVSNGLNVVVSAGNSGDLGLNLPTHGSVESPGTTPAALTVGATTNSHIWYQSVLVPGTDTPAALRRIDARFGDGPKISAPLTAPLRDVATLGNDGLACTPLANGSLTGTIALILRGDCNRDVKVINAQRAGAIAVILYQFAGSNFVFPMEGLRETGIPTVLIGFTAGTDLKSFLARNPDRAVTLDAALRAVDAEFDTVAYFSSNGPSIGDMAIKPEVTAVGTDLLVATQRFDPNGDLFDATGYAAVQGTSFSAPMVAGAAALVKQQNRGFAPVDIKSAIVNTATDNIDDFDANDRRIRARVTAVGAGKLNAADAVRSTLIANPATLSFGLASATLPSMALRLTNQGSAAANVRLEVQPRDPDSNARVTATPSTFTLGPGQTTQVTVRLEGSRPQPGSYEGVVVVSGGVVPLRIPYLYLVGDGVPYNIYALRGSVFRGLVGGTQTVAIKVLDRYGVPVPNVALRFRSLAGGGSIKEANERTDSYGIAEATFTLGGQLGEQVFSVEAGTPPLVIEFDGRARLRPTIDTNGIVNAASLQVGPGFVPGSYITLFGVGLADVTKVTSTASLPLSLTGVSVSFDLPSQRLSLPGRLHFVSDRQINVQIPWEFQGQTTVAMKVSIGDFSSVVFNLPLTSVNPAAFEYTEPGTGRLLAAVLDQNFALVGTSNPGRRGRAIQVYVNSLGPVDLTPASGEPTPAEPLARTRVSPSVTIGGRPAEVLFAGLAPNNVGLYQINVVVPADAPTGIQPLVITSGAIASKAANLPVE